MAEPASELPAPGPTAATLPQNSFSASAERRAGRLGAAGLLLILLATAAIRWPFLEAPLERDEGEFAYTGQLILQGQAPYTAVYAMKLPGTYLAYALIEATLGQSIWAIHFGSLLVNLSCVALVYAIGCKLFDPAAGVMAAGALAIVTASPATQGISAQAEHFVLLPALAGFLLLLVAQSRGRLLLFLLSGCAWGLALMAKQHGLLFVLFGLGYTAAAEPARWRTEPARRFAELAMLAGGIVAVFVPVCVWLLNKQAFSAFVFWTVTYPREYVSMVPLWDQARSARAAFASQLAALWVFWLAAGAGLTALVWYAPARRWRQCLLLFAAASLLSVTPGGYYRPHYFLLLAPVLALLAALGVRGLAGVYRAQGGDSVLPVILAIAVFAWPLYQLLMFLGPLTPVGLCRQLHGACPFPEAIVLADYLKRNTQPRDCIGILGSEPEIFFYADRHSATGHIYMYPLVEPHPYALTLQQQLIDEIEAAKPKFLLYCYHPSSWLSMPGDGHQRFKDWMRDYLEAHYRAVGIAETLSPEVTEYRWGKEVAGYRPLSPRWVRVLERRD